MLDLISWEEDFMASDSQYMAFNVLRPDQLTDITQNQQAKQQELDLQPLKMQAAQMDLQSKQLDMHDTNLRSALQLLQFSRGNPQAWTKVKAAAVAKGFPAEAIPDVYDENFINQASSALMSQKDKLDNAKMQLEMAKLQRENAYTSAINTPYSEQSQGNTGLNPYIVPDGSQPLSVRNNNPLNIRDSATGKFKQFSNQQEGLQSTVDDLTAKITGNSRAMQAKFGKGYQPTLSNIISTWAPPSENNTNNYINYVSQKTGIKPDQILTTADINKIMPAMAEMEGGKKNVDYFFGNKQTKPAQTDSEQYSPLTKDLLRRYNIAMRFGRTQDAESFRKMLDSQPDYSAATERAKSEAKKTGSLAAEQPEAEVARQKVSSTLEDLKNKYLTLSSAGAITNPANSAGENALAYLRSSGLGQFGGKVFGTNEQSIRNNIASIKPALINAIRQATGMSAKAMDSNAELQFYLQQVTDPSLDINTNLAAIDRLERNYGLSSPRPDYSGKDSEPTNTPATQKERPPLSSFGK